MIDSKSPIFHLWIVLIAQLYLTLCDPVDCSNTRQALSVHGISPRKNIGVDSRSVLQRIFLTEGVEPRSPEFQADSLPASSQHCRYVYTIHVYFMCSSNLLIPVLLICFSHSALSPLVTIYLCSVF